MHVNFNLAIIYYNTHIFSIIFYNTLDYRSHAPVPVPAPPRWIPSRMRCYDDHGFVFVAGVSCV